MERIKLGKITAPVGIKGEVRVYPFTDEQTRFSAIQELEVENTPAKVLGVRYQKNMVILKLSCFPDRNAAEAARGKTLYLQKDNLWEVPEDTYFISDLIGCEVKDEEENAVGVLLRVIQNTAMQDIYEIRKPDGKTFLLPAVKEFVLDVDTEKKVMHVHLIEGMADL